MVKVSQHVLSLATFDFDPNQLTGGDQRHFKISGRLKSSRFLREPALKQVPGSRIMAKGVAGKGASKLTKVVNIHGCESVAMASSLFGHQHWLPVSRLEVTAVVHTIYHFIISF